MDLSQLEVFLTVARERRFSRAAEKLFRTQSAVSQTIRKLELEIGEPLFDRSSRDGVLTDAGRVLQEYAEKLLNLRQDAQTALVEMRELQKGKLVDRRQRIYRALPVAGAGRVSPPASDHQDHGPAFAGQPHSRRRAQAQRGTRRPFLRSAGAAVALGRGVHGRVGAVVPPGHPLASAGEVSVRQLGAESFVAHIVASPIATR
jgi:DNA-binding transcriptional LysR family regulator